MKEYRFSTGQIIFSIKAHNEDDARSDAHHFLDQVKIGVRVPMPEGSPLFNAVYYPDPDELELEAVFQGGEPV